MQCKTCAHPQRRDIDLALLAKTHTLADLSPKYGLSLSSLCRHKKHLLENLDRARDRLQNSQQLGRFLKLNAILENVERAVDAAEADGNVDGVLRGAGVGARIIHQMSRLDVPLELDTVYRIISDPQWVSQDSLLPTDPRLIADLHQAILDDAFFPCPDPGPERAGDDDEDYADCQSIPETVTSGLRAQGSELLHRVVAADGLETFSAPENRQLSALPARHQREKSAKLPKNLSSRANNNEQNQSDNQYVKNIALNPKLKTENRPATKPDLSATLAEKTPPSKIFIPNYEFAILVEKDFAPNPGAGRESDAPPAIPEEINPPPVLAKVSSHPAQANVPKIDTRKTETGNRQTAYETENQPSQTDKNSAFSTQDSELPFEPLETRNSKLETLPPPGLTPEMRAQIFTHLFPRGNGARGPEIIPAPANKPAAKPPPKKGIFSNLLRRFRQKPASSPENAFISPQARPAGRESDAPLHLNEICAGYQKDIQEGIIVPGAFSQLLADIHPPAPHFDGDR